MQQSLSLQVWYGTKLQFCQTVSSCDQKADPKAQEPFFKAKKEPPSPNSWDLRNTIFKKQLGVGGGISKHCQIFPALFSKQAQQLQCQCKFLCAGQNNCSHLVVQGKGEGVGRGGVEAGRAEQRKENWDQEGAGLAEAATAVS